VGDQRITTAQVEDTVTVEGPGADGAFSGPRREATLNSLNVLVQTALLRRVAGQVGATVTPELVAQARDDADIRTQAAQFGVDRQAFGTFAAYLLSIQSHLATRLAAGAPLTEAQYAQAQAQLAELRAAAARADGVTVNPRYGSFDGAAASVRQTVEPGIKLLSPERGPAQAP
jgi:hypothetical protein